MNNILKNNGTLLIIGLLLLFQSCNNIQSVQNAKDTKIYNLKILDKETPYAEPPDAEPQKTTISQAKELKKFESNLGKHQKNKYIELVQVSGLANGKSNFFSNDYLEKIKQARMNFLGDMGCRYPQVKEHLHRYIEYTIQREWKNIYCAQCKSNILESIGCEIVFDVEEFAERRHFDNYSLYCSEKCSRDSGVDCYQKGYLFTILNQPLAKAVLSTSRYLDYIYRALWYVDNYKTKKTDLGSLFFTKATTIINALPISEDMPGIILDRLISFKYEFLLDFEKRHSNDQLKALLFITFCSENEIGELQQALVFENLDLERDLIISKSYSLIDYKIAFPKIHCLFETFVKWNTKVDIVEKFLARFTSKIQELKYDDIYELAKVYTNCDSKCLALCEEICEKIGINDLRKNILLLQCKEPEILKLLKIKTEDEGFFSDHTFSKISVELLEFLVTSDNKDKAKFLLKCENIDSLPSGILKLINSSSLEQLKHAVKAVENNLENLTHEIIIRSSKEKVEKHRRIELSNSNNKQRRPIFITNDNSHKKVFTTGISSEGDDIPFFKTPEKKNKNNFNCKTPQQSSPDADSEASGIEEGATPNRAGTKIYRTMPKSQGGQIEEKEEGNIKTPKILLRNKDICSTQRKGTHSEANALQINTEPHDNNERGFRKEERSRILEEFIREPFKEKPQEKFQEDSEENSEEDSEYFEEFTFQEGAYGKETCGGNDRNSSEYEGLISAAYSHTLSEKEMESYSARSSYSDRETYEHQTTYNQYFARKTGTIRPQNCYSSTISLAEIVKLNMPFDTDKEKLLTIILEFPWLFTDCLSKMERIDQYFLTNAINKKDDLCIKKILLSVFEKKGIENIRPIENLSNYISGIYR